MKAKKIILQAALSIFIGIGANSVKAQTFEWAKSIGDYSFCVGHSIKADASGNVYTAGWFNGTVDFDPGTGTTNLTSAGFIDVFVLKLDASGNLLWAKSFSGSEPDGSPSITVDPSGNVYTIGSFGGTVDFDPGVATFTLTSAGSRDVFVQKMDASGNFVWVKSFGSIETERGNSIAVDAYGNVYTAGDFGGTVDFDPGSGTANLTSVGGTSIFVQKMDSSGNFVWAKSFGEGNAGVSFIAVDTSGNVFSTGSFDGTVDFDPGAGISNQTSAGSNDVFVQKMDESGNFVWAKSFGGIEHDSGTSIAVDASGNVYTTGVFNKTVDFDPGVGISNQTSAGSSDMFVQKMNSTGNFVWAESIGGTGFEESRAITVDASGNVYITGQFRGTIDFDPGTGIANLTSSGGYDVPILKMDASGNFVWAKSFGGTDDVKGYSITVDASGNVYTTGDFQETADFDPGAGTAYLTSVGDGDIFVQKMSQGTTGVYWAENGIQITAYPNPGNGLVQISFEQVLKDVEITITDLQGKVVFSKHFDVGSIEQVNIDGTSGVYFLRVKTANGQSVVKLMKE